MNELKIINKYGLKHQQKKLNEEVFELQEAIYEYEGQKEACEFVGCNEIHARKDHILEEYSDVIVLLNQIKLYYDLDPKEIERMINFKISRQLERMNML